MYMCQKLFLKMAGSGQSYCKNKRTYFLAHAVVLMYIPAMQTGTVRGLRAVASKFVIYPPPPQSNVYSPPAIFSRLFLTNLPFHSFSLYRRSAITPPCPISYRMRQQSG